MRFIMKLDFNFGGCLRQLQTNEIELKAQRWQVYISISVL